MRPVAPPPKARPTPPADPFVPPPTGLEHLPPEDQERFRRQREAMEARFRLDEPRTVRRAKLGAVGCAVTLLLLNGLFTPVGFGLFPVQLVIGAALGVVLVYTRPGSSLAVAEFVIAGLATMLLTGHTALFTFGGFISVLAYALAGAVAGVMENLRAADGD